MEAATRKDAPQPIVLAACPLCRGSDATTLARFPELTWVRCGCSLIYKRSEHPDPAAAELYESGYFGAGEPGRHDYAKNLRRRVGKSRSQILDALNFVPPGPLLDIGCSLGYALRAAQDLGLEPAGMDLSQFAVQACREQGWRAEVGDLSRLPFGEAEFGLVTMKHVLEHTPDPRSALREVRRVLRAGGGLFIAIPHAAYHKAVRAPQKSRFYLPAAGGREHFVYYTPATLSTLLREEGFRVVAVNPQLVHRAAPLPRRLGEMLVAPPRWVGQRLLDALHLRKEFWLVAVRD